LLVARRTKIVADGATEIGEAFDRTMERRLERRRAERTFRRSALNGEVEREIDRRIRAGELIRATIIPPRAKAAAEAPAYPPKAPPSCHGRAGLLPFLQRSAGQKSWLIQRKAIHQ
jgi:hypothetical protein